MRRIDGLRELVKDKTFFIVDLWGVVHDGVRVFDGVLEALAALKARDRRVVFLSNTSRAGSGVDAMLEKLGVQRCLYDHVLTSGDLGLAAVASPSGSLAHLKGAAWFQIGAGEMLEWIAPPVFRPAHEVEGAQAILGVGILPLGVPATGTRRALEAGLSRELPFICANPDRKVRIGGRDYVAAGAVADIYEEMGGKVLRFGKPDSHLYVQILRSMDVLPHEAVALGDTLETDIPGAQSTGVLAVLVNERWPMVSPHSATNFMPDALIPAFRW